jgi:hypothetical protein
MSRGAGARAAGATGEGVRRATAMRMDRDMGQSEARMSRGAVAAGGRKRVPGVSRDLTPQAAKSGRRPCVRIRVASPSNDGASCSVSPAAARAAGATGEGVRWPMGTVCVRSEPSEATA